MTSNRRAPPFYPCGSRPALTQSRLNPVKLTGSTSNDRESGKRVGVAVGVEEARLQTASDRTDNAGRPNSRRFSTGSVFVPSTLI